MRNLRETISESRETKDWGFPLLAGLLFSILGALMLFNPFKGAATLTVIIAAVFFVNGMIRIIHGVQMRGMRGTGFAVLNGMLGILIAVMVFAAWPDSSMWLIGILIGTRFGRAGPVIRYRENQFQFSLNHPLHFPEP